jgi:histidinol dehydrogenase
MKKTSLIRYSPTAFRKEARDIICLATVEGLGAHANAIQVRLDKKGDRRKAKGVRRKAEGGRRES